MMKTGRYKSMQTCRTIQIPTKQAWPAWHSPWNQVDPADYADIEFITGSNGGLHMAKLLCQWGYR